MKHPALARVFAIVLMILCLLMLGNGISGFGKASAETAERIAFSEKYAERIETYIRADEELAHSISYEEAYEELEKLQEQHDSGASQHRTDVALYSAEKGGYTMGADMIWEAMPEVKGARQQMEFAKAQLAEKEKIYAENKGTIDSVIRQCNDGAAACNAESAKLQRIAAQLAAIQSQMNEAPPSDKPNPPAEVVEVIDPGEFTEIEPDRSTYNTNVIPGEDPPTYPEGQSGGVDEEGHEVEPLGPTPEEIAAYEEALADYNTRVEAYNEQQYQNDLTAYKNKKTAYDNQKAAYEEYLKIADDLKAEYERKLAKYNQDKAAYDASVEAYNAKMAALQMQYGQTAMQALPSLSVLEAQAGSLQNAAGVLGNVAQAMGTDTGVGGGMDNGMSMPSPEQMASMSPDKMIGMLQGAFGQMSAAFGQIAGGAGAIDGGLQEARNQVTAADKALREAESMMQGQLENIWYELGELEKDKEDLEKEKTELDEEAVLLSKKLVETEGLKRLKNRRISTRQLLISQGEVKARTEETGDLVRSAREFLEDYRQETERLSRGRRLINLLAVIGAAAGVIGIPAAYEKIKSRFWLLAPVVVCLCCAVAADGVNMALGLGQMYTALFTAIFAAIQLLILLPNKKIPTESV